jgi:acyl-CoA dehydrogenase
VKYALEYGFAETQKAFEGVFNNLNISGLTWLFRCVIGIWPRFNSLSRRPSDDLGHEVSKLMQEMTEQRERLTQGIYYPPESELGLGKLEWAFKLTKQSEGIEQQIKTAVKNKAFLGKLWGKFSMKLCPKK